MSYALDLARAHKERLARMWPEQKPSAPDPTAQGILASEVSTLERKKQKLLAEIEALQSARDAFVGEENLVKLRERVCADHGIPISLFISPARSKMLIIARKQFAQEARAQGASLPRIAYHIGGRNHATIFAYLHGKKHK